MPDDSPAKRRKRFEPSGTPAHGLTPLKLEALRLVAESRFLSTPQVAGLLGVSLKSARDHLRDLLDMELLRPIGVPGVALGIRALVGPTIYVARKEGLKVLEEMGLLPPEAKRPPSYGPEQYQFLAHELSVRDVLVWLTVSARCHGHSVSRWDCSGGLQVGSTAADALFHYDYGRGVIAGLVEADLGSERGTSGSRAGWVVRIRAKNTHFAESVGKGPETQRSILLQRLGQAVGV